MSALTGGAHVPRSSSTKAPDRSTRSASASGVDDYVSLCETVRAVAKVDLLQYKRGQMERRVRSFAERRGFDDLAAYSRVLRGDPSEVDAFLDRVTINVSQLWRNPEQWTVLTEKVLPELAETGRVRIWSAGSSYGAEAYTLAAHCLATIPKARTEIRGTDIDPRMVARARLGAFSEDDARDAPKAELRKHFTAIEGGGWQANRDLMKLVSFEVGDLLRVRPRKEAYDLVLCRNTVIYFNEEVRDALHARLVESIRPGGYLIIGATERVARARELGLSPTQPFTYRKA